MSVLQRDSYRGPAIWSDANRDTTNYTLRFCSRPAELSLEPVGRGLSSEGLRAKVIESSLRPVSMT